MGHCRSIGRFMSRICCEPQKREDQLLSLKTTFCISIIFLGITISSLFWIDTNWPILHLIVYILIVYEILIIIYSIICIVNISPKMGQPYQICKKLPNQSSYSEFSIDSYNNVKDDLKQIL